MAHGAAAAHCSTVGRRLAQNALINEIEYQPTLEPLATDLATFIA